jgi:hypothetical protein
MHVPRSTTTQRMVSLDYGPQKHYPNHREYARAVGEKGQKHWERYAAAQGISTAQTPFDSPDPDSLLCLNREQERHLIFQRHMPDEKLQKIKDELAEVGIEIKTRTHNYTFTLMHARDITVKFLHDKWTIRIGVIMGTFPSKITDKARQWLKDHGVKLLRPKEAIQHILKSYPMISMLSNISKGNHGFIPSASDGYDISMDDMSHPDRVLRALSYWILWVHGRTDQCDVGRRFNEECHFYDDGMYYDDGYCERHNMRLGPYGWYPPKPRHQVRAYRG